MSNFTKLRYTWLCKSLKECGSCEAFIFVSNVIFVLHLWRVKAVKAFLVFCINNKWKICWNCEAFSICLFVFHNIWKICWSREAFSICIFVFFITFERYNEPVKPFLFVYLFFKTFQNYAEAVKPFLFVYLFFFFITFERYDEPVKPFLFVYLFFKTFQSYAEAGFSSFSFPPPGNLPLTLDPGLPLQNCRSQKYSQNKYDVEGRYLTNKRNILPPRKRTHPHCTRPMKIFCLLFPQFE